MREAKRGVAKLLALLHVFRNPHQKPPDVVRVDQRLDDVEKRLNVLSVEGARRARMIVEQNR